MTADELARWQTEQDLVLKLIAKVERAEREILRSLRLPTDVVALHDVLAGTSPWRAPKMQKARGKAGAAPVQPARQPRPPSERERRRALHAFHVLVQLATARQHLGLGESNARLAAHAALIAGLYAGDSAIVVLEGLTKSHKGATSRGRQIAEKAAWSDRKIRGLHRAFEASDDAKDDNPAGVVQFVRRQTNLSRATVYRRLRALGLSTESQ